MESACASIAECDRTSLVEKKDVNVTSRLNSTARTRTMTLALMRRLMLRNSDRG